MAGAQFNSAHIARAVVLHALQAIELDGSQHTFFSNRSAAYLSNGQAQEALGDAVKCIELKGDWAKGYSRKGAALHAQKKYDEAVEAYNEGLKIDPSNAGLKSGLEEVNAAKRSSEGPAGMGNAMAAARCSGRMAARRK